MSLRLFAAFLHHKMPRARRLQVVISDDDDEIDDTIEVYSDVSIDHPLPPPPNKKLTRKQPAALEEEEMEDYEESSEDDLEPYDDEEEEEEEEITSSDEEVDVVEEVRSGPVHVEESDEEVALTDDDEAQEQVDVDVQSGADDEDISKEDIDTEDEEQEFLQELEADPEFNLRSATSHLTARQRDKLQADALNANKKISPDTSEDDMDIDATIQLVSPRKSRMDVQLEEEKQLKIQKRQQYTQKKLEQEKNETVDRLLKKKTTKRGIAREEKIAREAEAAEAQKSDVITTIRYIDNAKQSTCVLFLPDLVKIESSKLKSYPQPKICSVKKCRNPAKYTNPQSLSLSCGLEHYKLLMSK